MTLRYVPTEDRLHVAARLEDGRAVRLWLTQRMARALVTVLARHLERVVAPGDPLPAARERVAAAPQNDALHAVPIDGAVAHLVRNVTLKLAAERVALCFVSDLDFRPSLVLDCARARQWLRLLQRQFVTAGWPLDAWPGLRPDGTTAAPEAATLH